MSDTSSYAFLFLFLFLLFVVVVVGPSSSLMKSLAVQTIDADLENFLSKVLDSRALANVRKTCIKEEVFTLASLKELRDAKQLNIFTKGTETRIYNTLPGQLCLMLVTGVHISMKAAYPQKAYTKEFKRYFWRHQMILYVK